VHFLKVDEKQTNALILQYIDTRHSSTCSGILNYHNQGGNHDPAEIDAQYHIKQRWMEALYCSRRRDGQDVTERKSQREKWIIRFSRWALSVTS
jgi:hypothetical protein